MDAAPIWPNVKTFPWASFRGHVDVLSGGIPCQPFSCAGSRKGSDDPRHLFPYVLQGIQTLRPRLVFVENVKGIMSSKLGSGWGDPEGTPVLLHVLRELERVGYRAEAGAFSAAEVGASHRRERVFILAALEGCRLDFPLAERAPVGRWPARPGENQFSWEPPRVVGDPEYLRLSGSAIPDGSRAPSLRRAKGAKLSRKPAGAGRSRDDGNLQGGQGWDKDFPFGHDASGAVKSPLGGDRHGAPYGLGHAELPTACDSRVDELHLIGNGVVPATAEVAFRTLLARLQKEEEISA